MSFAPIFSLHKRGVSIFNFMFDIVFEHIELDIITDKYTQNSIVQNRFSISVIGGFDDNKLSSNRGNDKIYNINLIGGIQTQFIPMEKGTGNSEVCVIKDQNGEIFYFHSIEHNDLPRLYAYKYNFKNNVRVHLCQSDLPLHFEVPYGLTIMHGYFFENNIYLLSTELKAIIVFNRLTNTINWEQTRFYEAFSSVLSAGSDHRGNLYLLFNTGQFRKYNFINDRFVTLSNCPLNSNSLTGKPAPLIYHFPASFDNTIERFYFMGGREYYNFVFDVPSNSWTDIKIVDTCNRNGRGSVLLEI